MWVICLTLTGLIGVWFRPCQNFKGRPASGQEQYAKWICFVNWRSPERWNPVTLPIEVYLGLRNLGVGRWVWKLIFGEPLVLSVDSLRLAKSCWLCVVAQINRILVFSSYAGGQQTGAGYLIMCLQALSTTSSIIRGDNYWFLSLCYELSGSLAYFVSFLISEK